MFTLLLSPGVNPIAVNKYATTNVGNTQVRSYMGHYPPICRSGSSVGIMTDHGLEGPGIESRWGRDFPLSRPAVGSTQPPVQWVPGLSRG